MGSVGAISPGSCSKAQNAGLVKGHFLDNTAPMCAYGVLQARHRLNRSGASTYCFCTAVFCSVSSKCTLCHSSGVCLVLLLVANVLLLLGFDGRSGCCPFPIETIFVPFIFISLAAPPCSFLTLLHALLFGLITFLLNKINRS